MMYLTNANTTNKIENMYAVINGQTRKIIRAYSVVNGQTKLVFNEAYKEVIFTSTPSEPWIVPAGTKVVDIFCVGGGGGAGGWLSYVKYGTGTSGDKTRTREYYGTAGAGGYTKTLLNANVVPGDALTVVVGAGGTNGKYYVYDDGTEDGTASSASGLTSGGKGGESSVSLNGTVLVSASGGGAGTKIVAIEGGAYTNKPSIVKGASGGSGSCVNYFYYEWGDDAHGYFPKYSFGYNGQAGYKSMWYDRSPDSGDGETYIYDDGEEAWTDFTKGTPGTGQGYTTCEWGDSEDTPYSYSGESADYAGWLNKNPFSKPNGAYGNGADADHTWDACDGVVIIRYK